MFLIRQVDNGTPNFGSEITLRGLFEAGAVGSAAALPIETLSRVDGADGTCFGWEGALRSKQGAAQAEEAEGASGGGSASSPSREGDSGLVICLCFEGGPGTIGTVKVRGPP